jgi:hypothetical protein
MPEFARKHQRRTLEEIRLANSEQAIHRATAGSRSAVAKE